MESPRAKTIVESVRAIYEDNPKRLFARLCFPQRDAVELTYDDLWRSARRFASLLCSAGVKRQQVVVIVLEHGPEVFGAFLGAQLIGAIPSLFAFPSPKVPKEHYEKTLPLLLKSCATRFLLSDGRTLENLAEMPLLQDTLVLINAKDATHMAEADDLQPARVDESAVLQHSSGTTGLKKGIVLSNRAIVAQLTSYASALDLRHDDRIASWLPLYHDMGLIACMLLPMVCGVPVTMVSPFHWVMNPTWLLEIIDAERSTLCWLPNFAYNFLAKRVSPRRGANLRLDSMRAFINCAEPISPRSHDVFFERFSSHGLRAEALCTCYAMAENTFAITQGGIDGPAQREHIDLDRFLEDHIAIAPNSKTRRTREVVSSGSCIAGNEVRIVNDQRCDRPPRHVGEIAIRSDSMLEGYYDQADLTAKALENGWYFTGDLGYLAEGQLFVTGRKKDMVIIAGKNIYPQDVEELVSEVEGVHPGRVVAFGVYDEASGTEQLVVMAEVRTEEENDRLTAIRLEIARVIHAELECVAKEVRLLPHRVLLKSSSGKISRPANRKHFMQTQGEQSVLS
ncbi:MAG: AMP-binding protein [Deltaproteobacteria bacterium]|nr:AMP-binding protein [Deltaproteobacteria bacterium]